MKMETVAESEDTVDTKAIVHRAEKLLRDVKLSSSGDRRVAKMLVIKALKLQDKLTREYCTKALGTLDVCLPPEYLSERR